jgi:hypothetical protein
MLLGKHFFKIQYFLPCLYHFLNTLQKGKKNQVDTGTYLTMPMLNHLTQKHLFQGRGHKNVFSVLS